ncbi:MAG TPA: hypothetical protein VLI66_07465 [Terrabacter sp.]|nr:hypothetical protein [Terrabacter sp.]
MPYMDATGLPPRPRLDVIHIAWSADATELGRSLEPLRKRLHDLLATASDPSEASERRRAAEALESLARAGEQVLADIESLEAAKARLEADLLSAYAALHTIEEQQIAALPAGSPSRMTGKGVDRPGRG